jgi:nicotinic acid mononucleotide adenylyltransferase
MDIFTETLIRRINASDYKFYLALTGGGQSFIGDFTSISGASQTLVGAIVPYSQTVFDKFIRRIKVDSYASDEGARKLAVACFTECLEAGVAPEYAIGIGASNSVVKDHERVGREHRINIAFQTLTKTRIIKVVLQQGRIRSEEETLIKAFIYELLDHVILGGKKPDFTHLREGETFEYVESKDLGVSHLLKGLVDWLPHFPKDQKEIVIFSGSWNPYHTGHEEIRQLAKKALVGDPILELTIRNTDKGQIDFLDLNHRMEGIAHLPYVITTTPTFTEKVKLIRKYYPETPIVFVVGVDTWNRVWNPKYAGPPQEVEEFFVVNRVSFLVFGRGDEPMDLEHGLKVRILDNQAAAYRNDISSTQLRKKNENRGN